MSVISISLINKVRISSVLPVCPWYLCKVLSLDNYSYGFWPAWDLKKYFFFLLFLGNFFHGRTLAPSNPAQAYLNGNLNGTFYLAEQWDICQCVHKWSNWAWQKGHTLQFIHSVLKFDAHNFLLLFFFFSNSDFSIFVYLFISLF